MATREPFLDILRKGLRWGAFGGLGVYLYALMTDNPSLHVGARRELTDPTIDLKTLNYVQLRQVYQAHMEKAIKEGKLTEEELAGLERNEQSNIK